MRGGEASDSGSGRNVKPDKLLCCGLAVKKVVSEARRVSNKTCRTSWKI